MRLHRCDSMQNLLDCNLILQHQRPQQGIQVSPEKTIELSSKLLSQSVESLDDGVKRVEEPGFDGKVSVINMYIEPTPQTWTQQQVLGPAPSGSQLGISIASFNEIMLAGAYGYGEYYTCTFNN